MAKKISNSQRQKALQHEYSLARAKYMAKIRSAKQKGYIIKENIIPLTVREIKSQGKKFTAKMVHQLQSKTSKTIYRGATYVSELSFGEIVSAKKGKQLRKKAGIEKAKQTRKRKSTLNVDTVSKVRERLSELEAKINVVSDTRNKLNGIERKDPPKIPLEAQRLALLEIFDEQLLWLEDEAESNGQDRLVGRYTYAKHLRENSERISELIEAVEYGSGSIHDVELRVEYSFAELAVILNMGSLTPFQSERVSELSEAYAYEDIRE